MGTIRYFETLDSTNTYASDHFDELGDGDVIVAGRQTAGRGRLNRRWTSPPGNLYASFVVKEPFGEPFHATMASSLAVLAAVRDESPEVRAEIKWPNDIIVRGRKLCGVLCEGVIRGGGLTGIVCGMGVNVNLPASELVKISQPATSLAVETNREINLKKFTEKLAIYLNWYYITGIHSAESLYRTWKDANAAIGRTVTLAPPEEEAYQARVLDIGEDGRLLVEKESGEVLSFACGDIKIRTTGTT